MKYYQEVGPTAFISKLEILRFLKLEFLGNWSLGLSLTKGFCWTLSVVKKNPGLNQRLVLVDIMLFFSFFTVLVLLLLSIIFLIEYGELWGVPDGVTSADELPAERQDSTNEWSLWSTK